MKQIILDFYSFNYKMSLQLFSRKRYYFRLSIQFQRYLRGGRKRTDIISKSSKGDSTKNSENDVVLPKKLSTKRDITKLLDEAVTDHLKLETAEQQDPWSTPPTPAEVFKKERAQRRDPIRWAIRPEVNARETSIFLFPGQGAQYVGMIKDLLDYPNVKDLFEQASSILGYDLLKLCNEGPEKELNRTIHCQPAVFVTSLACVEKLKAKEPQAIKNCIATAGFSVGEVAALVFAEAFNFETGIRFIKARAEAMQRDSEKEQSGLMTVFTKADSKLKEAMAAAIAHMKSRGHHMPVCQIANYLFTQAKVIGGHDEALKFIEANAKQWNLLKCTRLAVSGAFHTPLMNEAYQDLKEVVKTMKIVQPLIPVHSTVDGRMYKYPQLIKKHLAKQVISPVRWEQLMHILYSRKQGEQFPSTYEMGPGKQLSVMLRKTNMKAMQFYSYVDN